MERSFLYSKIFNINDSFGTQTKYVYKQINFFRSLHAKFGMQKVASEKQHLLKIEYAYCKE